jgi:hypothetical protein
MKTIQSTVDYARTQAKLSLLSGVGGVAMEPALTIANDVMQEICAPPYAHKWNRAEMPMFITAPFKQDYLHAGAVIFSLTKGGVGIALKSANGISQSGTTVTVNTLENIPSNWAAGDIVYIIGADVAAYNSVSVDATGAHSWTNPRTLLTASGTSLTFSMTAGNAISGSLGITDVGWVESASLLHIMDASSPQKIEPISAVRELNPSSNTGFTGKLKVCVLSDPGTGILKLRLSNPAPNGISYGVNLVYQKKAPNITGLTGANGTWSPIPDNLGYMYRQGFLARTFRHIESPREPEEEQKFQAAIMKSLSTESAEQSENGLAPERSLMLG